MSRVFRNLAYFEHDRSQLELNFLSRQKHIENLKYDVTVKLKVIQDKMIDMVKIDFLNLSDFLNQDNYVTWVDRVRGRFFNWRNLILVCFGLLKKQAHRGF